MIILFGTRGYATPQIKNTFQYFNTLAFVSNHSTIVKYNFYIGAVVKYYDTIAPRALGTRSASIIF